MASCISTSWKVVKRAYWFCDYFSLCATLCLKRERGSLVSFLYPELTGCDFCSGFFSAFGGSGFFCYGLLYLGCSDCEGFGVSFSGAGFDSPPAGFFPSVSMSKNGFPTSRLSP